MGASAASPPPEARLESWKEIAAYLRRDVRTVQRWEKREKLPVHRHVHDKLGTVYAYKEELDTWWAGREPQLREGLAPRPESSHRRWVSLSAAISLASFLLIILVAPRWVGPAKSPQMTTRRVWEGPDVSRLGAVSPDGRYLAYSDPGTGDLSLMEVATGQQRRLTQKPAKSRIGGALYPIFSPDGAHIAYAWDLAYFAELHLIGADGSGDRVLYRNPDVLRVRPAGWSHDRAHVVCELQRSNGTHQIVLVGVTDGAARVLKEMDWRHSLGFGLSPDGRFLVYDFPPREDSPERDLFLLDLAGPEQPPLSRPLAQDPADDFILGWAPDGKTILFASDRAGTLDAWAIEVADGRLRASPRPVKKAIGRAWPMGFTREGAYYYGLAAGAVDVYMAELDPQSGRPSGPPAAVAQRFPGANWYPDWSPDGRSLAYVPRAEIPLVPARGRIITREARSAQDRVLTLQLNNVEAPRWSPDGNSLLVAGHDLGNHPGLFQVNVRTGVSKPLVLLGDVKEYFHDPAWSRDGKLVYYKLRDGGLEPARLLVRELTSGRERELLPSVYRYALSSNGLSLAFSTFDDSAEYLRIIPSAGGEVREIYRQPRGAGRIYSVEWMKNGRYILFAKKGDLWRIPITGGSPEKLGLHMEALRDLRLHPDGSRLAFTAGTGKGEVWVMENFLSHTEN